jgi:hypothetical protein
MNASIIMAAFADAMAVRNIIVPHPLLPDGKLHSCDAVGRNHKGDAAYVLHLDGFPVGGFENHRHGKGWETSHAKIRRKLTPAVVRSPAGATSKPRSASNDAGAFRNYPARAQSLR